MIIRRYGAAVIRPPWHWRLRRWLGFDSTRGGILYIPDELHFPRFPSEDPLLDKMIEALKAPLTKAPRQPTPYIMRGPAADLERIRL